MLYWIRFPFIRITLVFASGIAAGYLIRPGFQLILFIAAGLTIIYFLFGKSFTHKSFIRHNGLINASAVTLLFILGLLHTSLFFSSDFSKKEKQIITSSSAYIVRVDNLMGQTKHYQKTIGLIQSVHDGRTWHTTNQKVLLYLPKDQNIRYGDIFLIEGHPEYISPPANKHAFNYRAYMARRKVSVLHFLNENEYCYIKNNPQSQVMALAYSIRNHITGLIGRATMDDRVKAMLTALLTGQRDLIDEDTYSDFTRTGIIHILAVSGLHVGILYMILAFMTKPLTLSVKGRVLRTLLIIGSFLLFAMITGLTPSVLRAVLMFSLILLGQTIRRNAHILNTVFLSAFLLLLAQPMLLFETGFQLSYMAVIGIILYQPLLYGFLTINHGLLNWLWKLITVSLAAQMATLPITLYYFKQFPAYFLPANIIAIPFISLFIPFALIWLIFSPFPFVHHLLTSLLDLAGRLFLRSIEWIGEWPGSLISPVHVSPVQLVFILIITGSFYVMLRYRKPAMLWMIISSVLIISGWNAWYHFSNAWDKRIVYHLLPSSFCLELINGSHSLLIMESEQARHIQQYDFNVRNYCIKNKHIHTTVTIDHLDEKIPAIDAGNRKIFCWEGITFCIYEGDEGKKSDFTNGQPALLITKNGLISHRKDYPIIKEKGLHTLLFPGRNP